MKMDIPNPEIRIEKETEMIKPLGLNMLVKEIKEEKKANEDIVEGGIVMPQSVAIQRHMNM